MRLCLFVSLVKQPCKTTVRKAGGALGCAENNVTCDTRLNEIREMKICFGHLSIPLKLRHEPRNG
jgi:hypothetical protein